MRLVGQAVAISVLAAGSAVAQTSAPPTTTTAPVGIGQPLGVVLDGTYTPMSSNVKVYGSVWNAESCIYDRSRDLIVVPNRANNQNVTPNDAFVSLFNHDGSVHTIRWIAGGQGGVVLNHPLGSDIHDGRLYLADRDGGTADGEPSVSVIRMFDMETGAPAGQIRVPGSTGFNDIEVAADGVIYASQSGGGPTNAPMRLYRVTPDGQASILVEGAPLDGPNGVNIDNEGNVVVLNANTDEVLTFSPRGRLLQTERAAMAGNDGIVIMRDGTKYTSSVRRGGVSRIRPGQPAELIASGIPSAASMCHDEGADQLVIPMNAQNGLAFIELD